MVKSIVQYIIFKHLLKQQGGLERVKERKEEVTFCPCLNS